VPAGLKVRFGKRFGESWPDGRGAQVAERWSRSAGRDSKRWSGLEALLEPAEL
jgi:hypothetical protein